MCMLFAVNAAQSFEANAYLDAFFANSPKHPHGWGLAQMRGGGMVIKKECVEARKSAALAQLLKKPIRSRLMLAHIRYATIGNVDPANCHPFSGFDKRRTRWTLIHNGTIFDYRPISPYMKKQKGETDSERVFLYLIDELDRLGSSDPDERFELLERIVADMAKGNKLNLVFTDGEYLYVHTNCRETLFYLEKDGAAVFATAPLTGERWRAVPFCTLVAFKDGAQVRAGSPHDNEYIENAENVRMLYRIFSNL